MPARNRILTAVHDATALFLYSSYTKCGVRIIWATFDDAGAGMKAWYFVYIFIEVPQKGFGDSFLRFVELTTTPVSGMLGTTGTEN